MGPAVSQQTTADSGSRSNTTSLSSGGATVAICTTWDLRAADMLVCDSLFEPSDEDLRMSLVVEEETLDEEAAARASLALAA